LVNAADGSVLWTDRFPREQKDIFALQDEIAGLIAQNLQLQLGSAPRATRTVNPEAHRLVLEGRFHSSLRTPEGYKRAEGAFAAAIGRDAEYAPAYAGVAVVCLMRANYATQDGANAGDVQADVNRARLEAQRAIAIDPTLAEAHAALAYCAFMETRYEEAERLYFKAVELSANDSFTYAWRAMLRLNLGRLNDALTDLERTVELDPLWPVPMGNCADVLAIAGRADQALQLIDRAMRLREGVFVPVAGVRALVLMRLGRTDEAIETARSIRKHLHQNPRRGADDSALWILRRAGLEAEANDYLKELFEILPATSQQRGFALGAMGRFGEALPYLERMPSNVRRRLYWDAIWDPWRDDPRFQQLLVKLGCVEEYKVARATLERMLKENPTPFARSQNSAPSTAPAK
jgi:tetratricopeptide (TPR) repeat protein